MAFTHSSIKAKNVIQNSKFNFARTIFGICSKYSTFDIRWRQSNNNHIAIWQDVVCCKLKYTLYKSYFRSRHHQRSLVTFDIHSRHLTFAHNIRHSVFSSYIQHTKWDIRLWHLPIEIRSHIWDTIFNLHEIRHSLETFDISLRHSTYNIRHSLIRLRHSAIANRHSLATLDILQFSSLATFLFRSRHSRQGFCSRKSIFAREVLHSTVEDNLRHSLDTFNIGLHWQHST